MSVYDKVKKLADAKGVSVSKAEREMGFGNGTISGWKDGKPSFDSINKVAKYFGAPVSMLLEDE